MLTRIAELVLNKAKRKFGALARELSVYVDAITQGYDKPAVLFFPSQGLDDGAARLRAYAVADHLRVLGWRCIVCPKHLDLAGRRRVIRIARPDVIVMQTARHPLNRPHLFAGIPVLIDIDDADYLDESSRAPLVKALENSVGVIAGSRSVARFCRKHNDNVNIVWTGTPPSAGERPSHWDRPRIVAWAASSPVGSHEERAFVRAVLEHLAGRGIGFEFRVYANDGSEAYQAFLRDVCPPSVSYTALPYLPYKDFLKSLDTVAVGLAPLINMQGFASGKSFGKVLAYIDRDVPIITHAVVDHPVFFRDGVTALMLKTSEEWAEAIARLLNEPEARQSLAQAARKDFLQRLTTETAASFVDRILRRTLSHVQEHDVRHSRMRSSYSVTR